MPESENQNQPAETQSAAEQMMNPETQNVVFQQAPPMESEIDALAGLVSKDTLEKMRQEQAQAIQGKQPEQKQPENKTQEQAESKPAETEKKEEKKEETAPQEKGIFFKGKQNNKNNDIVIESPEQILEVVKSRFGQDLKDIKELPTFFESSLKWRQDSQSLKKVQEEANGLKEILEGLPSEMIEGIQKFYKGEDYTKVFTDRPKFDYSKPFEDQEKNIVNAYFPGKFSDEDFQEGERSEKLEIAIEASKAKFEAEKQVRDSQRARIEENTKIAQENYKNSLSGSVSYLKQSFPDVTDDDAKDIIKTLEGGKQAVINMFFNQDGTVKREAAEALMLAKYGKEELLKMANVSAHQAETRVNEEILTRGADTKKPVKNGGYSEQLPDDIRRQLAELETFKTKTKF